MFAVGMVIGIVLGFGFIVCIVVALIFFLLKSNKPVANAATFRALMNNPGAAPVQESPRIAELRQNLRLKFLHQEDKVDAAIQFERDRMPTASLEELMQAAITRWERDNQ